MSNYHPNAKSLVHGLSDFWTLYFKEISVIEELYRGVEIDVGQVYLDLLALLLNSSVQDTTLFNKQNFQLIRLREDAVTYSSDGKYGIALSTDIADIRYLNNKVFGVDHTLERDIDFAFDANTRSVLFDYDPFAAYAAATFDLGNAAFTITARRPGVAGTRIALTLTGTGASPVVPTLDRTDDLITITYNTSSTTTAAIVSLLNSHAQTKDLLRAALAPNSNGSDVPGTFTYESLNPQGYAPLEGYATRTFDVKMGTRFSDGCMLDWVGAGVRKGDVVRILGGGTYGAPEEFPIALVRDDHFLFYPQAAPASVTSGLEYTILRSPVDDTSTGEPLGGAGIDTALDTAATVSATARTLTVSGASTPVNPFSNYDVGSVLVLGGLLNAGAYVISSVTSPTTVVLEGPPLVNETNVPVRLRRAVDSATSRTNGVATAAAVSGTATLTSATSSFTSAMVGGVLVFDNLGTLDKHRIVSVTSATELVFEAPLGYTGGTGLYFAIAPYNGTAYTLAGAQWIMPTPGTLSITARRYEDGAAVLEGRDYTVNYDLGGITPLTVWQPAGLVTVDYTFRERIWGTKNLVTWDAVGSVGVGQTFTSPSLDLPASSVGAKITISGAAVAANNGTFTIVAVPLPNVVVLTGDTTLVAAEANNGSLYYEVHGYAGVEVGDLITQVAEMAVWAPDASLDRFHLYYTYGYLINRIQVSSEAYRALIRGLFQLFMLGPTLERFESAVNVVAGLPVVRDENELFLAYDSEALRSGTAGTFDALTQTFSDPAAAFTFADLSTKLYVTTGYNANKLFTITDILSATTVQLGEVPVSDTGASWELTATGTHSITTSRTTYVLPRTAPVKDKFLAPGSAGVLNLRAFEVLSAAFLVTDYVETPYWWENARIPDVLMPGQGADRRQSSPALFKNTIGPSDSGRIGDPGFYVGADDTGVVPTRVVLQSGSGGTLTADPLYPVRTTEVYFSAPTAAFTASDLGNVIVFAGADYLVTRIVSATMVQLSTPNYVPPGLAPGSWEFRAGTVAMRHKAAYVVLDTRMKYHLFTVAFDAFLLDQLPANVISELQELVFVAKPTYTYLIVTPALLFQDVIRLGEDVVDVNSTLRPTGQYGEGPMANATLLKVDGTWSVGSWYRYASNTGTFSSAASVISHLLGTPAAGTFYRMSKLYITPSTYTKGGVPIMPESPLFVQDAASVGGTNGVVTTVSGEKVFTANYGEDLSPLLMLSYIQISGVNYRIGRMLSGQQMVLDAPSLANGTYTWSLVSCGSQNGRFWVNEFGESFFTDLVEAFPGAGALNDANNFTSLACIRRPYPTNLAQTQRLNFWEMITPSTVRVAELKSLSGFYTDVTATTTAPNIVTVTNYRFTEDQGFNYKYARDPSTSKKDMVIVWVAGVPYEVLDVLSPTQVVVNGSFATNTTPQIASISAIAHYTGADSYGPWDLLDTNTYIYQYPDYDEVDLYTTGADASTAAYTSYGVREPTPNSTRTGYLSAYDAASGDTYYAISGVSPMAFIGRWRTALDADLQEWPVQIRAVSSTYIDPATWGTLSRQSEASYLLGTPTDGSTDFLAWAGYDARRIEDLGDGNGPMLLLEGQTTNLVWPTQSLSNLWALGAATLTPDARYAPDGVLTADRVQVASGGAGPSELLTVTAGYFTGSVYHRGYSSSSSDQMWLGNGGSWSALAATATTTWSRHLLTRFHATTSLQMFVGDGENGSGYGGVPATSVDVALWGMQLEALPFATSYIRTADNAGSAAVRLQDVLSGPTSTVPAAMLNGTFTFDVAPKMSSTDAINYGTQCIFSFADGASERIFFLSSGGSLYIRVTSGGTTRVTSNALTFSANQKLSVTVNGAAGSIGVAGATTGNGTVTGTSWTRTAGTTTYVGNTLAGTQPFFGRLGPLTGYNPSTTKILLVLLGQSNMQLHADVSTNDIRYKILGSTQGYYPRAKMVGYQQGGSKLNVEWNKAVSGSAYTAAVAALNAAYTADPTLASYTPVIVWGQGESDANDNTATANYAANLPTFFTNLEGDVPWLAGCRKVINLLWPSNGLEYPGSGNNATIRAAQAAYAAAHPTLVHTVETSDLSTYDTIHFDDASTKTLGQRDAAAVAAWGL